MANIALVGLGNLGSRHLQGLVKCMEKLAIRMIDPSPASVLTARSRWSECGGDQSGHVLLEEDLPAYNVAIIATTADRRISAMKSLSAAAEVATWVVEKPVAQSLSDLARIESLVAGPAWVNTTRRLIPWHREIADEIARLPGPFEVLVSGGSWGLACNAVHFIDLARWWTGSEPVDIDVRGLEKHWHDSKRPGYVDVYGTLLIAFSDGSNLTLVSTLDGGPHKIELRADGKRYQLEEGNGRFVRPDGTELPGRMAYQSELTGQLVDQIIVGREPGLPALASIAAVERLLLSALIPHRMADGGPADRLDVT